MTRTPDRPDPGDGAPGEAGRSGEIYDGSASDSAPYIPTDPYGADPYSQAGPEPGDDTQYTTVLRRPGAPVNQPPVDPGYQETTVLRRPAMPPPASNIPGADRGRRDPLPPYTPPDLGGVGYPPATPAPADAGASHLAELTEPPTPPEPPAHGLRRAPRKLTVTRVAALRSRELTHRGLEKFHGAVSADGADLSGLGHLTYAVMGNYAVDAALAVALANTLFFAAATAESTGKVLLYLLLTVAPFAVIAPLVGPALDKLQHGRRIALAASSVGRAVLAVIMAFNFDSWIIYPCALGMLVLSKGFGVLKAALAPRVLPPSITLVKTNSRLSVFGLVAGGIAGGIAAGIAALVGSAGALWFTALCGLVGAWLCLRIPSWVESTSDEVPIEHTGVIPRPGKKKNGMPHAVVATLWSAATVRISTGFLGLFVAFVIKIRYHSAADIEVDVGGAFIGASGEDQGWMQLLLLGAVGAAAGLGGFVGNALGAKLPLNSPQVVALWCLISVVAAVVVAFIVPGLITTAVVAFVASTASSLAKVCLDATIQTGLPESSRASAFGRIESVLQLSWVFGGVMGLLIGGVWALGGDDVFLAGFGILGLVLLLGLTQSILVRAGRTMVPRIPRPKTPAGDSSEPKSPQAARPDRGNRATARTPSNATGTPRRTRKLGGGR